MELFYLKMISQKITQSIVYQIRHDLRRFLPDFFAGFRCLPVEQSVQPAKEPIAGAAGSRNTRTGVVVAQDLPVAHALLLCVAHSTALAHAHAMAEAVVGHAGRAAFVRAKVEAVTGGNELADITVAAAIGHKGVVLHKAAQILVGGVGADVGLTGAAVVVLFIGIVFW